MINIFLDESGDLGFGQGSSRYFTISFIVMKNSVHFIRYVKEIKIKYNIPRNVELKGNTTRHEIKEDLLAKLQKLDIEIHAITVKKKSVEPKLRRDPNILYNYMVGLILVERILAEPPGVGICVNVDRRVISITSGFKFNEYLRYKVWYEGKRQDIDLEINHLDSHRSLAIQGIDIICNSIFKKYNSNSYKLFNIIRGKIRNDKRLFFSQ